MSTRYYRRQRNGAGRMGHVSKPAVMGHRCLPFSIPPTTDASDPTSPWVPTSRQMWHFADFVGTSEFLTLPSFNGAWSYYTTIMVPDASVFPNDTYGRAQALNQKKEITLLEYRGVASVNYALSVVLAVDQLTFGLGANSNNTFRSGLLFNTPYFFAASRAASGTGQPVRYSLNGAAAVSQTTNTTDSTGFVYWGMLASTLTDTANEGNFFIHNSKLRTGHSLVASLPYTWDTQLSDAQLVALTQHMQDGGEVAC